MIIGICIEILLIPISSAVNVNTELDDEAKDNYDIEPLDKHTEIISITKGKGYDYNRTGFSVNITNSDIDILSHTTNGFYIEENDENVYIGYFLGYFYSGGGYVVYARVFSVAIKNIEW